MLVLSRRAGESIDIGGQIKIQVVKIQGNRVRIGIDAPDDIQILRGELSEWSEFSFDDHDQRHDDHHDHHHKQPAAESRSSSDLIPSMTG